MAVVRRDEPFEGRAHHQLQRCPDHVGEMPVAVGNSAVRHQGDRSPVHGLEEIAAGMVRLLQGWSFRLIRANRA